MKLSKEDFRGSGKVFRFTLEQMIKSRANIASLVVMVVLMLLAGPVMALFGDNGGSSGQQNGQNAQGPGADEALTAIYYLNHTDYDIRFEELAEQDGPFAGVPVEEAAFNAGEWQEQLKDQEALVEISHSDQGLQVDVLCLKEKSVEAAVDLLARTAGELVEEARLRSLGAGEGQMEILMSPYSIEAETLSSYLDEEEVDFGTSFGVQYAYSILVLILGTMSASYIIRSVIEEKSSKLVELLMISVRPLAMLLGKILAVMVYIFGMLVLIFGSGILSMALSGAFLGGPSMGSLMGMTGLSADMLNIGPMTVIIILLFLFSGYCTVGILSGIAGAGCSTTEDMESANMNVVMLILAGYLVASITSGMGSRAVGVVMSFLPIVSVFCAPVQYVLGNINLAILCVAWLVQMAVAGFLAVFCARVYSGLIFHKGNKLGLKELMHVKGGE